MSDVYTDWIHNKVIDLRWSLEKAVDILEKISKDTRFRYSRDVEEVLKSIYERVGKDYFT